ncbi:MAG: DUF362 domain-containing protein [Rhodospirillales bacterium]|nr:DUF362 domain-containing protein [Rhodospirillales bacterium]
MIPSQIPIPLPGGLHGPLPKFIKVGQQLSTETIESIEQTIASEFKKFSAIDLTGKSIALGVGSRGIKHQRRVVEAVLSELKAVGANPFIIPTMGSHGGGSAAGQLKVLESYGYTEASMGVPIRASMDVVELDKLNNGTQIYCDRIASEADYIIACGRVKPHTDFRGPYESGLIKMLAIGLGKHAGATALHFNGFQKFKELIPEAGEKFIAKANLLFGIAMVENANEDLRHLELVAPKDFMRRDAELLELAKASIPKLLFKNIDLLIVDEIGKNISGAGMDPNVTGRPVEFIEGFDIGPAIGRIMLRDLTAVTEGNASGIGIADVVTQRILAKMDWTKTYVNIVTAGVLDGAKMPIIANNDRDAIGIGIRGCPGVDSDTARIVRISNTLEMNTVWASQPMADEIAANPGLTALSEPFDCAFSDDGDLLGAIE